MLPERVSRLATESFGALLQERRRLFSDEINRIVVELAAKGIRGGPTLTMFYRAAIAEIALRKELAAAEVQRAAESAGIRYYPKLADDLTETLQRITKDRMSDVLALVRQKLHTSPNAGAAVQRFDGMVIGHIASRDKGYTDLHHFAESLQTKRGSGRRSALSAIGLVLLGAVAAEVARWVFGLVEHLR